MAFLFVRPKGALINSGSADHRERALNNFIAQTLLSPLQVTYTYTYTRHRACLIEFILYMSLYIFTVAMYNNFISSLSYITGTRITAERAFRCAANKISERAH